MSKKNHLKTEVIKKLQKEYGFVKDDADFIYDIFIDCFLDVWKTSPEIRIPKMGVFRYSIKKGNLSASFTPNDYFRAKMKDKDWEEFVNVKFKHIATRKWRDDDCF